MKIDSVDKVLSRLTIDVTDFYEYYYLDGNY